MKTQSQQNPAIRPLFLADWDSVVMIHLEVPPEALQKTVLFPIDRFEGTAFVTLVAFTLRHLRPVFGGRLTAALLSPIATHAFLNVRTYVQVDGEPGIHFLAEWLPNWLSVFLGPRTFGLPYRHGSNHYLHAPERNTFHGCVTDATHGHKLTYHGSLAEPEAAPVRAPAGTREAFLWERYTAFNDRRGTPLKFEVKHDPWPMHPLNVELSERTLLTRNWPFMEAARLIGAHFCYGLNDVQMSGTRVVKF